MFLQQLHLVNFRNYQQLQLDLAPVTLFIGDNAQGKSNLLEAIYFLATTKSYRAEKDAQLINQSGNFTTLTGVVTRKDQEVYKLEIGMQLLGESLLKRVKVNGIPKRVVDYIGNLVVVAFTPEDIALVFGSPSLRRWHIDLTLAQIDRSYKKAVTEYSEVIVSRNKILKKIRDGLSQKNELDFWTDRAVDLARIIHQKREELFKSISGSKQLLGEFNYIFHPSVMDKNRLEGYLPREIAAATSLIGPHRDDFSFHLNDKNLSQFGSRGEQRTAVLELKLRELEYINQTLGEKPLLILDDIFSELDKSHRDHIVSLTGLQQTIISAIEEEVVPEILLKESKIYLVKQGSVV